MISIKRPVSDQPTSFAAKQLLTWCDVRRYIRKSGQDAYDAAILGEYAQSAMEMVSEYEIKDMPELLELPCRIAVATSDVATKLQAVQLVDGLIRAICARQSSILVVVARRRGLMASTLLRQGERAPLDPKLYQFLTTGVSPVAAPAALKAG